MSDTFQVTKNETGLIRLFAVDLPPEEIDGLREAELARALGVDALDVDQIDLFSADDLKGLGLVVYMTEGLGIAEAELDGDRARLDRAHRLGGAVLTPHLSGTTCRFFAERSAGLGAARGHNRRSR